MEMAASGGIPVIKPVAFVSDAYEEYKSKQSYSDPAMLHDSSAGGPFPGRHDTMALDVIRPKDVPKGRLLIEKEDSLSLRSHDIKGATCDFKWSNFFKDGPPIKDEIKGNAPRKRFAVGHNRPVDMALTTADIEKAQPKASQFTTSRCVNPLTPRYDLPSFTQRPLEPPKQMFHDGEARDTLAFKGDWQPRILERDYARDPLETRDVEFSQPNLRKRLANLPPRDNMKIVEKAGERILSSRYCATPRETNPLEPSYNVSVRTTHPFRVSEGATPQAPSQIGAVVGSTPRQLHKDNGEPQASLIRSDLPGAVPQRYKGAMPLSIYDPPEVTPFTRGSQLDCSDIEGTQTGSRRAGAL